MKILRFTSLLVITLSILAGASQAQRTRKPAPRPTPVRNNVNPVISTAKQQVSNQLYNVNVFVEKIGPIAVAIETADRDAAARKLNRDAVAANEANKRKVVDAIRVLRTALVNLESDFRTKPLLSQYLPKIEGISALAADSEDSAIAGKFVAAKDPLREIALKLNDTLAVMPGTLAPGSATPTVPARKAANTTAPAVRTVPAAATTSPGAQRDPVVGMTTAEVSQSSWGTPSSKRTSSTANGTTEVWTYSGKGTIYFFNGKVTQILR